MAALLHNVVGLQNASMAIYNAWCDRVPLLLLGGTGPKSKANRRPWIDWIHTASVQANIVRDFVKWDDEPHDMASVAESFARGLTATRALPSGPVYLCYDVDLQEDPLSAGLRRAVDRAVRGPERAGARAGRRRLADRAAARRRAAADPRGLRGREPGPVRGADRAGRGARRARGRHRRPPRLPERPPPQRLGRARLGRGGRRDPRARRRGAARPARQRGSPRRRPRARPPQATRAPPAGSPQRHALDAEAARVGA